MGRAKHSARNSLRSAASTLSIQTRRMKCRLPSWIRYLRREQEPLWKFYEDAKLAQFLPKQGSRYVAVNGGTVKLFPAFVQFFNHAADISDGMYPSGSPPARFTYTLKEMPSNVEGLTLKIGSETLSGPGQAKAFTWTGAPEEYPSDIEWSHLKLRTLDIGRFLSLSLTLTLRFPVQPPI